MAGNLVLVLAQLVVIHATRKEGQKLSSYLWEQTTQYQEDALDANLPYGMKEKCLNPSEFGGYMVDDTVYLLKGAESLGRAAAKVNGVDDPTLKEYMEKQAEKWNGYWEWLNEIWHIKDAAGIRLGEAAEAYMNHIKSVSEDEKPVYTIVALTPCAKLWPWIGTQLGSGKNNFGVYTSWVEINFDPSSTTYKEYDEIIDQASANGEITDEKALEIYTASIQNEVQFFNSVKRCQPSQNGDSGKYQEYSDAIIPKVCAVLLIGVLAVFVM